MSSDLTIELVKLRRALAKEVARRSNSALRNEWRSRFRMTAQWGIYGLTSLIPGAAGAIFGNPAVEKYIERKLTARPSTWFANLEMGAVNHQSKFLQTIGEDHPMYRMVLQPNDAAQIIDAISARGENGGMIFSEVGNSGLGVEHKDTDS